MIPLNRHCGHLVARVVSGKFAGDEEETSGGGGGGIVLGENALAISIKNKDCFHLVGG